MPGWMQVSDVGGRRVENSESDGDDIERWRVEGGEWRIVSVMVTISKGVAGGVVLRSSIRWGRCVEEGRLREREERK